MYLEGQSKCKLPQGQGKVSVLKSKVIRPITVLIGESTLCLVATTIDCLFSLTMKGTGGVDMWTLSMHIYSNCCYGLYYYKHSYRMHKSKLF